MVAEPALKHERAHPEDWVAATSPSILLLHGLDGTVSRLCSRSAPLVHVRLAFVLRGSVGRLDSPHG